MLPNQAQRTPSPERNAVIAALALGAGLVLYNLGLAFGAQIPPAQAGGIDYGGTNSARNEGSEEHGANGTGV